MLTDGLRLFEGSDIQNAVVASGTSFPTNPDNGELFYRTDLSALHVFNGTLWEQVGLTSALLDGQSGPYYLDLANSTGVLSVSKGGTGSTTPTDARNALGLIIGTDIQGYDADLQAIGALAGTSGFLKKTAANTWSLDTTSYLSTTGGTVTGNITMTGHIIPSANVTYDLGSPTNMWRDLYVGPGSIYMNGQKILENVSNTIIFSADPNQNVRIETEGSGNLELLTASGSILIKSPMTITTGKKILDSAGIQVEFGDNIEMGGNRITGLVSPAQNSEPATKGYVDGVSVNDSTIVRTSGAQTIAGDKTFTGITTLTGQVMIQDNIIELNSDFTSGVPTEEAGLQIRRGDSGIAKFVWDEANDRFTMKDGVNAPLDLYTAGTITATNFTGLASSATVLATGRTFAVTGDATGTSAAFTGAANASIPLTLATVNSNVGSFGSSTQIPILTVNAKGLITAASTASINTSFTITGDVSGTIDGGTDVLTLASVGTAQTVGSATQVPAVTTDAKGRVTGMTATTIAIPTSAVTSGTFADARIAASNVTQHQAALTILESQITDAGILARNAGTETISGAWTFSNPVLVGTPTANGHATTKLYVDTVAQGLNAKPSVRAATTANLTATYDNGTAGVGATLTFAGALPTVDGVTLAVANGVLVKNQTAPAQNGRYNVTQLSPGILTRCGVCDEASEIPGAFVFVQDGTLADTGWVQSVADPSTFTVGTDAISVYQFSGAGSYIAGTGLTLSSTTFSISNIGTAGTYRSVTTNAQGQVTAGTNPTTLTGYGITDAVAKAGDTMTGTLNTNIGGGASSSLKHIDLSNGAGYDIFMLPRGGAGSYNNLTQAGDAILGYSAGAQDTGALVIGPWSGGSKGLRIDSVGDVTFTGRLLASVLERTTAGTLTLNASNGAGDIDLRTAGSSRLTVASSGTVTVQGPNLWVGGPAGLLLQHTAGSAYIRAQNTGGTLFLGAESTNTVGITPTGVTVNTGGLVITAGGISASGAIRAGTGANGYAILSPGNATNTGYTEFIAPNGIRQGYIGYAATNGAQDTGTISYIAGTHAFTGAMTVSGALTATLSGNATTATTLQTARTIALSGAATGTATSFNGSANITIPVTSLNAANLTGIVPNASISGAYTGLTSLTSGTYVSTNSGIGLRMKTSGAATGVASLIYSDSSDFYLLFTADGDANGTYNTLRPFSVNKTTGAVSMNHGLTVTGTLTGVSGIVGTLSGNASTATTLQTARTINGTSFNGSANITVTANTPQSLTFNNSGAGGGSGTTFSGAAATVSYNTIGAPSTTGANASGTWSINVTGSAGSTTKIGGGITGLADLNTALVGSTGDVYYQTYATAATNKPVSQDNANGLFTFITHPTGGSGLYGRQLAFSNNNDQIYTRAVSNGSFGSWVQMLTNTSVGGFAPSLTGAGASGTWSINITGNAQTLGGLSSSTSATASTIAARDGNGYLYAAYLNQSSGNSEGASGVAQIMYTNGTDNFLRKTSISQLTAQLPAVPLITVTASTANSIYPIVWHSGTTLYDTAATMYVNPSIGFQYAQSFNAPNWFRSTGDSGWYNSTYNTGIHSTAAGAVRTYNGTNFISEGYVRTGNYFYADVNYGHGLVGLYSATRYQNIYSMGDAYKPLADGTGLSNMYGIAYTHTNIGGESKSGLSHQALFVEAGITKTAIGTGIWTAGNITVANSGVGVSFSDGNQIRNNLGTYGSVEIVGTKGGYSGIRLPSSGDTTTGMYDGSGNGGEYDTSTGWHTYWLRSISCLGIGGSSTASGYKARVNGALYADGDITAFSDRRVKDDIQTIPNGLAKVEAMRGVSYIRNDNGDLAKGKRSVGVIAQEVEAVVPELVYTNPDDDMKGVNYGQMVGVLIEAIKDLSAQNKALMARLEALEAKE